MAKIKLTLMINNSKSLQNGDQLFKKLSSLPLSEQLVGGDGSHSTVGSHQTVVDWDNLGAVPGPSKSSSDHRNLLETGNSFNWGVNISNVGSCDEPLDSCAVEEYYKLLEF